MEVKEELTQHLVISQKNVNAIQHKQKEIVLAIKSLNDSINSYTATKAQCSTSSNELLKADKQTHEQKRTLLSLSKKILSEEKSVGLIKQKYQVLNSKIEALNNAQQEKGDYSEMKLLKKALNKFSSVYQCNINTLAADESTSYRIIITFIFNGKMSEYPIEFLIDRESDTIIDVVSDNLLSKIQHDKLLERYKQTNNNIALICTLRNAAIKRHLN